MTEPVIPELLVPIDGFEVTRQDVLLVAQLQSTYAVCIYDAVETGGCLLHLRVGPQGRSEDPEITDTTLTTDLLLLDRSLSELRRCEPRAKHLQAKILGHVEDTPGARARFDAVQAFMTTYLADAELHLVSCHAHFDSVRILRFRPAMGHVRSEPLPGQAR